LLNADDITDIPLDTNDMGKSPCSEADNGSTMACSSNRYCWWRLKSYVGWKESVEFLHSYLKTSGPFDGLLGFSQGSSLISLLLSKIYSEERDYSGIRFVMLFSGFVPSPPNGLPWEVETLNVASLHVYGEGDKQV
jgi:hypothetical protein